MPKRLWITWENHRRSKELASSFQAEYYPLIYEGKRPLRYIVLTIRTIFLLLKKRPNLVFCQNPSIVLAALLAALKKILRYKLIVDRHSNFKLKSKNTVSFKWKIFHFLSKFTIRRADLTVVTNDQLDNICSEIGGESYVLQDKIPSLTKRKKRPQPGFMMETDKTQVMFVTMFDPDEPVEEIIEASKALPECICYLTGNFRKNYSDGDAKKYFEFGVIMTGFISDEDYLSLMENSDLVVVLTKNDLILNCGAYEAISMEKPLILSDTPTLRDYFGSAAIYTKCNADEIYTKIIQCKNDLDTMLNTLIHRKAELENLWSERFSLLEDRINHIGNSR